MPRMTKERFRKITERRTNLAGRAIDRFAEDLSRRPDLLDGPTLEACIGHLYNRARAAEASLRALVAQEERRKTPFSLGEPDVSEETDTSPA